ncbi:MAG: ABC transporter ATP-binding protein [Bdellovibrionaceae bacterium]|nr:ABC transporter ATP-binding protein [Pseudobdellovibrionaceae bacterium]
MLSMIKISNLNKVYAGGFQALKDINLNIKKGEIFALLGPNGAGKTTLISVICGINNATDGEILINGFNIIKDYRKTRSLIGLVPQELTTDAFETVWDTVNFTRGLFGLSPNHAYIEKILKSLSLWDKKNNKLMTLSGGMKRRVLIAKALSHEPRVLFLDEPTAGVDVELRKDMWSMVRKLQESGVTIILTTHYIEEAEEMADRIGVINNGEIILVENKDLLMQKLGSKNMSIDLRASLENIPMELNKFDLKLVLEGTRLIYTYNSKNEENKISEIFDVLNILKIPFADINTNQSSLEEIFVSLVK